MRLLVIGSGGREHAIAWKLAHSPRVQKVFVAPGNCGTATENGLENLPLSDFPRLIDFCKKEQVHLTVVGPEAPLAAVGEAAGRTGTEVTFLPSRRTTSFSHFDKPLTHDTPTPCRPPDTL